MKRLLFVCAGNICRSPLAEGFFRDEALKRGRVADFEIRSCGTIACDGIPPSEFSVTAAREYGVDISHQTSSACTDELLDWADMIFCMAGSQVSVLRERRPDIASKIGLLDPSGRPIEDPYGLSLQAYRHAALQIRNSVLARIEEI